jgi:hypothetical protein
VSAAAGSRPTSRDFAVAQWGEAWVANEWDSLCRFAALHDADQRPPKQVRARKPGISAEERREQNKLRMRERRLREGRTPHAESKSRTKPWLAAGFNNRRTWERHLRKRAQAELQAREAGL